MAAISGLTDVNGERSMRGFDRILDVATISKADDWVEKVLPRFVAFVRANCGSQAQLHLLLLIDEDQPAATSRCAEEQARSLFDQVVTKPFRDASPELRLLAFDALRAGLPTMLGLQELLYIDPDTDVVADLRSIREIAPHADLLWAANPFPLQPVLEDLAKHGFHHVDERTCPIVEPGFLYLRRDLSAEFTELRNRFPDVHRFAPGSTYWTMLARQLAGRAARLPDEFNRTFWDIPAAASSAKSIHFTGQWKRLQPFVEYRRGQQEIVIRHRPAALPSPAKSDPGASTRPAALAVVALYRDNADYLPHALERFVAWERGGLPLRYHFLENDSVDATGRVLEAFIRGRPGKLIRRQLAARYASRGTGYDRVMTLARMRSYLLDEMAAAPPPHPDEWTLMIDSGIYFPENILEQIFQALASDPRPDSIGMITCYTQQLFSHDQVPIVGRPAPGMPDFRLADHYYDTYAFHDLDHRNFSPLCGFARCRYCGVQRPPTMPFPLVPAERPIVDVAAAFGGFALVPTSILRDTRLRWTTYGNGVTQAAMLSEHVLFCDRLRTLTEKRIVVLQDVDGIYRR